MSVLTIKVSTFQSVFLNSFVIFSHSKLCVVVVTEQQPWFFGRMNRESSEMFLKEVK